MNNSEAFKEACIRYNEAIETHENDKIELEKYKLLWTVDNLFELVVNYVFLDSLGITFDFGSSIIKKGTKLYRIRNFKEGTDFSNPKEWSPSPHKSQGRINAQGEEALYLGSSEMLCILETHHRYPEKYVLGEFECIEDLKVGGFISCDMDNNLHTLASTVLNAFLIAPSRCERNKDLFSYLEQRFGAIAIDNLVSIKSNVVDAKEEMKLPYKFALLNQREGLHNLTNQICKVIKKQYPEGIRYSSCFFPVETPGIISSEYNLALFSEGIKKVKYIKHNIKTIDFKNPEQFTDVNIAKVYLGDLYVES